MGKYDWGFDFQGGGVKVEIKKLQIITKKTIKVFYPTILQVLQYYEDLF